MPDTLIDLPGNPLTWWRCLEPHQIAHVRRDLLDELLKLTRPLVSDDLIGRVMNGNAQAALVITDNLGAGVHSDLTGSWLAWAAVSGDHLAPAILAGRLIHHVLEHPGEDVPQCLEETPEDRELWSTIGRRLRPWHALLPSMETSEERETVMRCLERQKKAESDAVEDDPLGLEALHVQETPGVTRTVVERIGDTGREGRGIAAAYRELTRPLPLAGGDLDAALAASVLETEFPWMREAVEMVRGELALRQRAGLQWLRLRPLLLLGPTGVGKTRFARRLATLAGTGYGELSVAGASDNRALQGTARGWSSAQPAYPLQLIRDSRTANPIIVMDEIDKATGSHNGDVRHSLLGLLEGHTAAHWYDECLMSRCDLSGISWILTANRTDHLPAPLLSRLRIVRVAAPEPEHFDGLRHRLLWDMAEDLGVRVEDLPPLGEEVTARLRAGFTRTPDVRRLASALRAALEAGATGDLSGMQ